MKVLVRVPNWIGDAVLSVAALRELRRLYPGAHITVLCRSWVGGLFDDLEVVDRVMTLPDDWFVASRGPRLKPSALVNLARRLKSEHYDRAVLFQNALEAALLAFGARIPERVGYATDRRRLLLTASCQPRTRRASLLRSFAVRTAFRAGLRAFPRAGGRPEPGGITRSTTIWIFSTAPGLPPWITCTTWISDRTFGWLRETAQGRKP